MAGQSDLAGHLVELRVHDRGKRVVLPVDRTGLERGVDLSEGHRRRVRAKRLAEELPGVRSGHAQVDARQIGRGFHVHLVAALAQVHVAAAQIHHANAIAHMVDHP